MDRIKQVKQLLDGAFPDSEIDVFDLAEGQDYLGITVLSPAFKGLSILEQHRLVMDQLRETLKEELHAVKIKTRVKND